MKRPPWLRLPALGIEAWIVIAVLAMTLYALLLIRTMPTSYCRDVVENDCGAR